MRGPRSSSRDCRHTFSLVPHRPFSPPSKTHQALAAMVKLELPHINLLTKMDL
jgi:hypothetical protein